MAAAHAASAHAQHMHSKKSSDSIEWCETPDSVEICPVASESSNVPIPVNRVNSEKNEQHHSPGLYSHAHHMFVDADMMKQKLKEQMLDQKDLYDVTNFYKQKGCAQHIARHYMFETVTLAIIASNGLWIAIDTDLNSEPTLLDAKPIFVIAENFFCAYFAVELLIRFLAFESKRDCLRDAWFVFDGALVTTMILETWVMTGIMLMTGASGNSSLGNASILRLARLLRLTRVARIARLLRAMPELVILVKGMVAATRSVVFTLLLMLIIIYVFAIAFRQVTDGSPIGEQYFESVPHAMGTLLNRGAFIDELSEIADAIMDEEPWLLFLLYPFVLVTSLTLMNMLVGVLVEVVQAVASTEKEALTINYVREKLEYIIKSTGLDDNGDGLISREEFMSLLNNDKAFTTLASVNVDVVNLVDAADFIFQSDEVDMYGEPMDKQLTLKDFMEIILSLRGTNAATVRDIVDLRKFVTKEFMKMEHRTELRARTSDHPSSGRPSRRLGTTSCATSLYASQGNEKKAIDALHGFRKQSNDTLNFDPTSSHFFDPTSSVSSFKSRHGDMKQVSSALAHADRARDAHSLDLPCKADANIIEKESSGRAHFCGHSMYQHESANACKSEPFKASESRHTVPLHEDAPSQTTQKPQGLSLRVDGNITKELLALPGPSPFQRFAEAKFRRLLLELEGYHEAAISELRAENRRLLDELSTIWHSSVWHVADSESLPSARKIRELY